MAKLDFSAGVKSKCHAKYHNRCAFCGCAHTERSHLEVHHKIPKRFFEEKTRMSLEDTMMCTDDLNALLLCHVCHGRIDHFDDERFWKKYGAMKKEWEAKAYNTEAATPEERAMAMG
jgi:hypothetical protein